MQKFHPGDQVRKFFWKTEFVPTESLYEAYLKQVDEINAAAGQYFYGIPAKIRSQHAIKNSRFGYIKSNIVEVINSA